MKTIDALSRLTALAEQRRAKTATLHAAVQRLLAQLPTDREISTVGRRLSRATLRDGGNCYGTVWQYTTHEGTENEWTCDIEKGIDSEGYHCGQFGLPFRGPSRADLIDLAEHAAALVAAAIAAEEKTVAYLDAVTREVEAEITAP